MARGPVSPGCLCVLPLYGTKFISIERIDENFIKISPTAAVTVYTVHCIIPCGTCDACLNTPARTNLCENVGVYGLMPDDDVHLNGYFGEYLEMCIRDRLKQV